MADYGHNETEKLLRELENKIASEYRQAVKETQAKLDDYLRRYQIKDEAWRKMVANGTKTQAEYNQWRTGQIMVGNRWREMQQALAQDYHNANVIARSMINQYMPGVYALNHNYGTFEVEKGGRVDTSYTLYDRATVERLMRDNPELLQPPGKNMLERFAAGKDIRWQEGQIQSVMLQGILQGESIPNISKRIAQTLGESNHKSTIRYARTAATNAQNAGRQDAYTRAEKLGVNMRKKWIATLDNRTRHEHRQLDGQIVDTDEPFKVDGYELMYPGDTSAPGYLVWNCFPANTKVAADCDIVGSYKSYYNGELIEIKTARGAQFSCTPNHPILTPSGWISAASLNNGDCILVTFGGNRVNPSRNPHIKHIFPRLGTFHHLMKFFFGFQRVGKLRVNFHGDIPASDVEIVSKERFLRIDGDTSGSEGINKFLFKLSNAFVTCKRHFVLGFWRVYVAALCFMRGRCESLAFLWRRLRHSVIHGFRFVADVNATVAEYAVNNLPGETEIRSELLNGLSSNVFLDHVISVKVCPFSGHIYNLQTKNGYYFAGSSITQSGGLCNDIFVIAKNCRCTTRAMVKGWESKTGQLRSDEAIGGMSYDEWKKGHGTSESITKQEEIAEAMRYRYIKDLYSNGKMAYNGNRNIPIVDGGTTSLSLADCKTFDELSDYFANKYGITMDDAVKALHFDGVKTALSGVEAAIERFPQVVGHVTWLDTDTVGFMCSDGKSISFNPRDFLPNKYKASAGFTFESGAHELGHCIDHLMCSNISKQMQESATSLFNRNAVASRIVRTAVKEFKVENPDYADWSSRALRYSISSYSLTDTSETLAEAVGKYTYFDSKGILEKGGVGVQFAAKIVEIMKRELGAI